VLIVAAARQNPPAAPAAQTPVFRSGIDLLTLDVSVLDKNRQPVHGLTRADFSVFEDGKPQTLEAFSAVDLPDVVPSPAKWMRDVTPDVTTNEIHNQRMFVIVMDDAGAPRDLWAQRAAKESAVSFIDRLGPTDLAAVIFTGAVPEAHAQELTSDHARLKVAVDTFNPMAAHGNPCRTLQILVNLTETLRDAGVQDRRKAVVFLGTGIGAGSGCPVTLSDLFRVAQQANVNFYPLDVCGLRPFTIERGAGLGCVGRPDSLLTVAGNTGGKAIVYSNDFEPGLTQIFAENKSYYLLGYRPTNVKADGTFRRLEVKVSRKDVEVRTREQYIAPKAPPPPGSKKAVAPPAPAVEALSNILPKADVPLRIAVAPFAAAGKGLGTVAIALGVRQAAVSARTTEEVDLLVRAFTSEGEDRGKADQKMTLALPPPRRGSEFTRFDLLARIDLKPGKYQLRLSAHSAMLDRYGSVYADIEVPDFEKAPLSMPGVMLSVVPGAPVAPAEALRALVPVIPTTEREFQRIERVSTFLRIYQGGKDRVAPVALAIRIMDDHDKTVVEQSETLGVDRFATARAADQSFALPLPQLSPGQYLLTFEATMGKATTRRDVRFAVR
jgi:VWFA-related protein